MERWCEKKSPGKGIGEKRWEGEKADSDSNIIHLLYSIGLSERQSCHISPSVKAISNRCPQVPGSNEELYMNEFLFDSDSLCEPSDQ